MFGQAMMSDPTRFSRFRDAEPARMSPDIPVEHRKTIHRAIIHRRVPA
jgi:hypothetical protein